MARVACLCIAAWCQCTTVSADGAERSRVSLEWHTVEGCPERDVARRAVFDLLEQRGTDSRVAIVTVSITRGADSRFHAQVSTQDESGGGDRNFAGSNCQRVTDAAVLIVVMALEALQVIEHAGRERDAFHRVPIAFGGANADVAPRTRFALGIQVAGDVGSLPAPSLAVGTVFSIQSGRLHVELDANAWLPRLAAYAGGVDSGAEIGLFSAGLRGCYDVWRAFGLEPCVSAEAGMSVGHGVRLDGARPARGFWGAAFLGLRLRQLSLAGSRAFISIEAGVPYVRPNYVFEEGGRHDPVFRAAPIVGRASIGVVWIF